MAWNGNNQMKTERHFDAFISYRHIHKELAAKIQEMLENFSVQDPETGKKRHLLIFRDESELPVSEDLSADITQALENSRFLIILASKAFQESKWCMRELKLFREMHGNTNKGILSVLVEDEPDEAYPEVIRYQAKQVTDMDGCVRSILEEVEPLGTDIRGNTLKEQLKRLRKTEIYRLAAPILGMSYDDLYQRHRRSFIRKCSVLAGAVCGLAVIFGVMAGQMIRARKDASRADAVRLMDLSDLVSEEDQVLAMMLAEEACSKIPDQDVLLSEKALQNFQEKAIRARIGEGRAPLRKISSWALPRTTIRLLHILRGGTLMSLTDEESTYLYNPETAEMLFHCEGTEAYFDPEAEYCFVSGIEDEQKTVTGYRTDTGEPFFSYAIPLTTKAPSTISVVFDTGNHAIYLYDMETPGTNSSFFARIEEDFTVTEQPEASEEAEKALNPDTETSPSYYYYHFYEDIIANNNVTEEYSGSYPGELFQSAECKYLFQVNDGGITVYEPNPGYLGAPADTLRFYSRFSEDGSKLLTLSEDAMERSYGSGENVHLQVCDMNGGSLLDTDLYTSSMHQTYLCSTDHKTEYIFYMDPDGILHLVHLDTGEELFSRKEVVPEQIQALAVQDGGKLIAVVRASEPEPLKRTYSISFYRYLETGWTELPPITCDNYICRHIANAVMHMELSDTWLFVSSQEDSFIVPIADCTGSDLAVWDQELTYFDWGNGGYGNNSDPFPRMLTEDNLLFFTESTGGFSLSYKNMLYSVYDLGKKEALPFSQNGHAYAYSYEPKNGFLVWQDSTDESRGGKIYASRLTENRDFEEITQIVSYGKDMCIPSGKSVQTDNYVLIENKERTELYDVSAQKTILSLDMTGLALKNGKVYDISQEYPDASSACDIDMDAAQLKELSRDLRTNEDGEVRVFTEEEKERFGITD